MTTAKLSSDLDQLDAGITDLFSDTVGRATMLDLIGLIDDLEAHPDLWLRLPMKIQMILLRMAKAYLAQRAVGVIERIES